MKAQTLSFVDALEMHLQNPKTFEIPSSSDVNEIKPGWFVKVCLVEPGECGERFWCKVTKVNKKQETLYAEIDNHLVFYDYPVGTKVKINFSQIYDIMN